MEWIIEAITLEDLVDGYGVCGQRIVRCKDCKWWKEETEYDWDGVTVLPEQWCTAHDCYIKPDGFCSWGERREEE